MLSDAHNENKKEMAQQPVKNTSDMTNVVSKIVKIVLLVGTISLMNFRFTTVTAASTITPVLKYA